MKEIKFKKTVKTKGLDGGFVTVELVGEFLTWGLDTDEGFGSWTVAVVKVTEGMKKEDEHKVYNFISPGNVLYVNVTDIISLN